MREGDRFPILARLLTRSLFVQPLEGDARLSLAARLQPDSVAAAAAVGVEEAVGDVPRPVAEAAAFVALQRRRCKKNKEKEIGEIPQFGDGICHIFCGYRQSFFSSCEIFGLVIERMPHLQKSQ